MANAQKDRYVLEKRLGAGAMGEVWLAADTLLNRPVAIKYLKATEDARIKELFLSEARTLASLHHPNITLIYDAVFDEEQSRFYLVMEYVQGEPLSDIIDNWDGPLPLEITLDLVTGIVEALAYAHNQGIVHRDIKPANVIIQKDGVKLTDFGIAGLISLLAEGTDAIIGTPAYISPEQIDGQAIDGRADLYSLGIMLYELSSGQGRPFKYMTQTRMFIAHLQEDPPRLKEIQPDIPLAMERTIMRLLEKSPEDRFNSAAELLETLTSIQARQRFSQPHLQFLDPEEKPFVNRSNEVAQIERLWEEIQDTATPQLLVVQGKTGSGKTRLVTEFLGRAVVDQGLIAVAGRCDEAGVPYAPYAEILGTIFNRNLIKTTPDKANLDELLQQIPNLARLLNIATPTATDKTTPSSSKKVTASSTSGLWQTLSQKVPNTTTDNASETQWQFPKTVLDIMSELGEVVIFLEDAGYLDEASVKLTRFLIRQGHLPLLIMAACRSDGETPTWLNSFSSDEKFTITLPPLATPAIQEYLTNLIGGVVSEEVVSFIEQRSYGNPLDIEEISQRMIESSEFQKDENGVWQYLQKEKLADAFLPKSVLGVFTRRIEKLSSANREALALAALLEPCPEFNFEQWSFLLKTESPEQSAQEILDEAIKKRLLRQIDENRYGFRPPDVAKALAATLTGTRRLDLHKQMAGVLHQAGVDPILVAYHYEQAGQPTKAAHYLEQAGAKATSTNAREAALTYYHRAATLVESSTTYKVIGDLQRQQGNHAEAINAYQRTAVLAKETGDVTTEAQALNNLSLTLCLNDQYQEAYRRAEQVLKLDSVSATEQAITQSHLGLILWLSGRLADAEDWCQKAIKALSPTNRLADLAEAYYRLGLVHTSQGKFNKARVVFQSSLKLRRDLTDETNQAYCLSSLGKLVAERGDFEQALSLFDTTEQIFKQTNSLNGLIDAFTHRACTLLYIDQVNKALLVLTEILNIINKISKPQAHILSSIYRLLAQANLQRNNMDIAKAMADDAFKLVEVTGNREQIALNQATLAQIYAGLRDFSAAQVMYTDALGSLEKIGSRPGLVRTKLSYAQFLARQGQAVQAANLEQEARDEAAKIELFLPVKR